MGALSNLLLMSMSEAFFVIFSLIKLSYTKALEWSSLVPGPQSKFSSSGITNLTLFTLSHHTWTSDFILFCSQDSSSTLPIEGLLLLLSRFSRGRLCATPETAAHQAPSSLGFSRQEHRSRLPFPSPVHESENWKWSLSVASYSSRPHGLQPTRLLHPWDFPGKVLEWGATAFSKDPYFFDSSSITFP